MRLAAFAVVCLLSLTLPAPLPVDAANGNAGSPGFPPLAGQVARPVPPELVAFGREIAADLRTGRGDALATRFQPVPVVCPQFQVDGALIPLCEGVEDGATVSGCMVGRIRSDAGWVDCESSLPGVLSALTQREFRSSDVRLYTVALTGLPVGTLACPECAMLVFSTSADAEFDTEPARPGVEANVAYFQVIDTPGGLRIHSYAVGHLWSNIDNFAILNGGVADVQEFFRVLAPGAPGSGTGLTRDSGPFRRPTVPALFAVALALLGASALVLATNRPPRSP